MTVLGPFDEKAAMNGAGFVPNCVLEGVMYPLGYLSKIFDIVLSYHIKLIKKPDNLNVAIMR